MIQIIWILWSCNYYCISEEKELFVKMQYIGLHKRHSNQFAVQSWQLYALYFGEMSSVYSSGNRILHSHLQELALHTSKKNCYICSASLSAPCMDWVQKQQYTKEIKYCGTYSYKKLDTAMYSVHEYLLCIALALVTSPPYTFLVDVVVIAYSWCIFSVQPTLHFPNRCMFHCIKLV